MSKLTLLEIVQDILSSIDGDEVNSINDTTESYQVAQVVKTTFESMTSTRDWPHLNKLTQLGSISDVNTPTHMSIPTGIKRIKTVSYNKRKATDTRDKYESVEYLQPEEFIYRTNSRNVSKSNVIKVSDLDGADIFIINDCAPSWWTSFDDENVVFDSYDSAVDDSLQNSKTQVFAVTDPSPFEMVDTHVPDLPSEAFSGLLAESKSVASFEINQIVNNKAEQIARRNNTWLSRNAFKAGGGIKYTTNYGRRRRRSRETLLQRSMRQNNNG